MSQQATIQAERQALPIFSVRKQLIDAILSSQKRVVIVVGATGSGKSTQLPQYLIDADRPGRPIKRITITQPRRVAAISLALRVARERDTALGQEVGYTVRFDSKTSDSTRIRYATDGLVIREALLEPTFSSDSIVIVDEAHERSVSTDLLLGFLKTALAKNNHLRVVIMSATINSMNFARYFNTDTLLSIQGRQYSIDNYFLLEPAKSYQETCISTALQICKDGERGDILIFMPGELEIRNVVSAIREQCSKFNVLYTGMDDSGVGTGARRDEVGLFDDGTPKLLDYTGVHGTKKLKVELPSGASSVEVLPFYANLSTTEQMRVFTLASENVRRVIVATNIAETSITVPNIRYVINCGFVRKKVFHHTTGMSELVTLPCSQASVLQRAGRAGRLMAGECYHIYTHETYATLELQDVPEIIFADLMPVFLTMIAFGITNPVKYEFITDPPLQAKKAAIIKLSRMGCIQVKRQNEAEATSPESEPRLILSSLGREVVRFPTDPELAIAILTAHRFGTKTVKDVLGVVSIFSCDGIFSSSIDVETRDQSFIARTQFYSPKGDHITLLNIWHAYCEETENRRGWCAKYYLSFRSLEYATNVYRQLLDIYNAYNKSLKKRKDPKRDEDTAGEVPGLTLDNEDKVLFCLLKGYVLNVAHLSSDKRTYEAMSTECRIHPASCLKRNPECVLFHELMRTSFTYMCTVSEINPAWIEACI